MRAKFTESISRHILMGIVLLVLSLLSAGNLVPANLASAQQPVYNTAFLTDAQLEDYNSMNTDQIQKFLASYNSYFRQPIQDVDGQTFDPPAVIAQAAGQYRISPKVILATLEKESNGVTRTTRPSDATMRFLMGCVSSSTARQQLTCAAERFRAYHDQLTNTGSTVSGWRVGVPKTTQDGVTVTPATKAVAGQFTYTPYAGVQWGGNQPSVGGVYLFYYAWNRFGFGSSTSCSVGQYRAEYYNNRSLSGSPTFTRCEGSINYDWGSGGPGNGVGNDNFSVRWTGRHNFGGGNYTFIARADDGIRVWVDGNPIIDAWRDQAPTEYRANRSLSAGEHEIKVEYYENGGGAVAQFRWEQASVTCPNQYRAEYYNNRSLSGNPTFVRCENWPINHDWGSGGPGNGVGNDNFSVRWTGRAHINSGNYTFIARADDGIRVWVGGNLIIDAWRDQAPTEYRVTRYINNGDYDIKVEYYENGGGAVAQFRWEQASSSSYNRLVAKHSGRCMDVYGASRDNGAAIIQWDCHNGDNQAWSLVPAGNDYYKLVAKHSGKCLDVYGASRDNGARLIQWDCHGGDNQLFRREQFGSYYRLRAKHSNRCVDVYGAERDNGVRLIQWDCHGGDNQLWAIQSRTMAAQDEGEEFILGPVMDEYILPITGTATTAIIEHTVQEGDSLELMISIYEVSIGTIFEANPELRGINDIQLGAVLRIPVPVPHYEMVVPPSDAKRLYLPIVVR